MGLWILALAVDVERSGRGWTIGWETALWWDSPIFLNIALSSVTIQHLYGGWHQRSWISAGDSIREFWCHPLYSASDVRRFSWCLFLEVDTSQFLVLLIYFCLLRACSSSKRRRSSLSPNSMSFTKSWPSIIDEWVITNVNSVALLCTLFGPLLIW